MKKRKETRIGITMLMKPSDIPDLAEAVPGTAAFDYLSGKKKVPELAKDERLWMVVDPQDGQPGLVVIFNDRTSLSINPPIKIPVPTFDQQPNQC